MSRALRVLFVFVVLLAAIGGAVVFVFDRPSVVATESRFAGVNASTTLVETDLVLSNPNPVGVRFHNTTVTHSLVMNGIEMGTGSREGLKITEGTTTIALQTAIDNRKIPEWWITHIRNGERTRITATARVRSPLLGTATVTETREFETHLTDGFNSTEPRPITANLPLISDPILVVNRTSATWGNVTREGTPLDTELVVYNPQEFPLVISRIDYTVTMNGIVVGNGTTGRGYTIPAHETRTIDADAVIETDALDEWWVTHLYRNQHTDVRIAFTAVLSLPGGNTVEIPLVGLGYDTDFETDILETKNESDD